MSVMDHLKKLSMKFKEVESLLKNQHVDSTENNQISNTANKTSKKKSQSCSNDSALNSELSTKVEINTKKSHVNDGSFEETINESNCDTPEKQSDVLIEKMISNNNVLVHSDLKKKALNIELDDSSNGKPCVKMHNETKSALEKKSKSKSSSPKSNKMEVCKSPDVMKMTNKSEKMYTREFNNGYKTDSNILLNCEPLQIDGTLQADSNVNEPNDEDLNKYVDSNNTDDNKTKTTPFNTFEATNTLHISTNISENDVNALDVSTSSLSDLATSFMDSSVEETNSNLSCANTSRVAKRLKNPVKQKFVVKKIKMEGQPEGLSDIEKRISDKKKRIAEMKVTIANSAKHDVAQLDSLISKWRTGCQEALSELLAEIRRRGKDDYDMNNLLSELNIPMELVHYSEPDQDFY
ncbi:suppressor of Mek1-like [Diaphorina citri]|uniref:Suppressor of Mek1-like n=1 Tax=Diaphorina citri TaxID=121845 RepID=A0A3Q0J065_DIACI|nr:suppressor of Mek1-like [Diaphorina citri]